MEWNNPAKIADFQQASYAKQSKLAAKLQDFMKYRSSKQEDIEKLKLYIGLPLYGVPGNSEQLNPDQEEYQDLPNIFDRFSSNQQKNINSIISAILSYSKNPADRIQVSKVLLNLRSPNGQSDVYVLRIRLENDDEKKVVGFADGEGRFYKHWKDFLLNNTLPICFMVYPRDGKYIRSDQGEWFINGTYSAACSLRNSFLEKVDMVCHMSGLVLTGLGIGAYLFRPMCSCVRLPRVVCVAGGLVNIATGTYFLLRNAGTLIDKRVHRQTLSLEQKENRQLWINTTVGAFGLSSLGIYATLESNKTILYNAAIYSSHFIFGASLSNFVYNLYKEKRLPTFVESAQFSMALFYYCNTVLKMQTTSQMLKEEKFRKHLKYPIRVGSSKGKRIAMEVQDELLSQLYDKVTEHEHRIKQLENGLGFSDTRQKMKSKSSTLSLMTLTT
uniref:DUF4781 domain-containing protein n=1 Tax=Ditylenchus dipsaci TaxID=166011 RepID=A0A915CT33_9BILA